MKAHKLIKRYLVESGRGFRLRDYDPADTHGLKSEDKPEAKEWLEEGVKQLAELQDILYAQSEWALLIVIQAMDAAGKDSTIKHVTSGVNPQGVDVYSFKRPSEQELLHDYLWRANLSLPPRGKVGIFNRSYYEEVLVVRVHPELLEAQHIPKELRGKHLWQRRYEEINAFESYLVNNGIAIRKFFLNVSKKEQKKRFMERLKEPQKNWKFSPEDVMEREHWDEYQDAYEKMIRKTATKHAPWIVVPADNKWFTRLLVVASINDLLQSLNLQYPKLGKAEMKELRKARKTLEKE